MATTFSQNLRPATWRGIAFEVDSTDLGAGRRTQLHEYPQRDKPWVEDLGRAARELSFEGFVVGPDYVAQANALLAALEEPGPGTLVHPWFGTLTVSLKELARVSFNAQLGFARLSMSFVESGELAFPQAGSSTPSLSRIAAQNIETAAVADFANFFTVDGFQDFVGLDAIASITNAFATVTSAGVGLDFLNFSSRAASSLQSAISFLTNPQSLGLSIVAFLGLTPYVNTTRRWQAVANALVRLAGQSAFAPPAAPVVYTPSRQQSYVNTVATQALVRQALLAQAVGASSLGEAAVYQDTIELRNNINAALDAESLNASSTAYTALVDARATVWRDLTERARDTARLTSITPAETTPAIVLAYDYYADATRATDIVARNRLRHPGFVPPAPLRVLTR